MPSRFLWSSHSNQCWKHLVGENIIEGLEKKILGELENIPKKKYKNDEFKKKKKHIYTPLRVSDIFVCCVVILWYFCLLCSNIVIFLGMKNHNICGQYYHSVEKIGTLWYLQQWFKPLKKMYDLCTIISIAIATQ